MTRTSILSQLVLVCVLGCGSLLPQAAYAQQKTLVELTQNSHHITTLGKFESKVRPDRVTVVFSVKTFDKMLPTAYTVNSQNSQKLIALAPKLSIEKADVQTSDIQVSPEYPQYPSNPVHQLDRYKPIGYTVSRDVAFVLKDVDKLATLMKTALQDGANGVQGVSYECSQAPKHRAKARIEALKAAREKAEALAAEVGCKIGKAISITEGYEATSTFGGGPFLQGATNGTIGPQGADAAYVSNADQGLALGLITIDSEITATFELE